MSAYLCCPECGKRRVTLRLRADDAYVCDRCGWSMYATEWGETGARLVAAFKAANPGVTI